MFNLTEAAHKYILARGGQVKVYAQSNNVSRDCSDFHSSTNQITVVNLGMPYGSEMANYQYEELQGVTIWYSYLIKPAHPDQPIVIDVRNFLLTTLLTVNGAEAMTLRTLDLPEQG